MLQTCVQTHYTFCIYSSVGYNKSCVISIKICFKSQEFPEVIKANKYVFENINFYLKFKKIVLKISLNFLLLKFPQTFNYLNPLSVKGQPKHIK